MPSFIAPFNYDTGPSTAAIAVGDVTGSGIPDIVFLNGDFASGTPAIGVLLGRGDGTFAPAVFTPGVQGEGSAFFVADFTGNGRADVLARAPDGNLAVYLSQGDGTFAAPMEIPGTATEYSQVIGDLNGDGLPDLVVTNGTIQVYINNGDGTFAVPTTYALPVGSATNVVIGDFNGDGTPDILVSNAGTGRPPQHQGTDFLAGNGDGTFQTAVHTDGAVLLPGGNTGLITANLTRDGETAVVYSGLFGIVVRLSSGDGTLQDPVTYNLNGRHETPFVTDLNGDGIPDLLVPLLSGTLAELLGNGDGTFTRGPNISVGGDLSFLTTFADFNGDGQLDYATVFEEGHGIGVRLGNSDGTFQSAPLYPTDARPWGVAVGDFNHDGAADVAVATNSGTVDIFLGNGDGTFQPPRVIGVGSAAFYLAAGDFNRDGNLDLAVETDQGLEMLLGNGDGTFQPGRIVSTLAADLRFAGDFNGDGNLDLVLVDGSGVELLVGNGDGTFQPPRTVFASLNYPQVTGGDFNGDHHLDLAVLNVVDDNTASINVLLGNGDGTFQAPRSYVVSFLSQRLAAADLTGTGRDDLLVSRRVIDQTDSEQPGIVDVYFSNPDGTLQPAVDVSVGPDPGPMIVARFNRDPYPDIAVLEGSSGASGASVRLLIGNGDGTFQFHPFTYSLSSSIGNEMALGDFNADGQPDLVNTNTLDDSFSILLSDPGTGPRGLPGQPPRRKSVGSFAPTAATVDELNTFPAHYDLTEPSIWDQNGLADRGSIIEIMPEAFRTDDGFWYFWGPRRHQPTSTSLENGAGALTDRIDS